MSGGPGDDVLNGGPFRDALSGNDGDDQLLGGRGRDKLRLAPVAIWRWAARAATTSKT